MISKLRGLIRLHLPSPTLDCSYDDDAVAGSYTPTPSRRLICTQALPAWGALKAADYGNATSESVSYNSRVLISHYALGGVKEPNALIVEICGSLYLASAMASHSPKYPVLSLVHIFSSCSGGEERGERRRVRRG